MTDFDQVVLVDTSDVHLGSMGKIDAHKGSGALHRAVSVVIYRVGEGEVEILLQQRSAQKLLWPHVWSNAVCTHPVDGESNENCAVRRLDEELGIQVEVKDLQYLFSFVYQAKYDDDYSEHEYDHVFLLKWDGEVIFNEAEVGATQWMRLQNLIDDMTINSSQYTPWFHILMKHEKLLKALHS